MYRVLDPFLDRQSSVTLTLHSVAPIYNINTTIALKGFLSNIKKQFLFQAPKQRVTRQGAQSSIQFSG
jgi:hypothetical protein